MISPAEAERLITAALTPLASEDCPLDQAHGRILREPVVADRDAPPFDRVTLDGFAVSLAALEAGVRRFRVIGMQPAGTMPLSLSAPDEAVEIATGAVLPGNAGAILPYEDVSQENGYVIVPQGDDWGRRGIHRRASDVAAGAVVVPAGTRLSGREIAVAASCGRTLLRVGSLPRIAVVATGDELVDVTHCDPAPHQIRRSNDYALRAVLLQQGFPFVERFHIRDHRYELEQQLKRLISEFDVVLLSGGVSKGKYDFLPKVLEELGVKKLFQGVAQRPGKPFWFGRTSRGAPVFALPGNPVSTFTCFHRFALPALLALMGAKPRPAPARLLSEPAKAPAELSLFIPVRERGDGLLEPMPTNTSGDFTSLVATDGFVEVPSRTPSSCGPFPFRSWS